MLQFKFIPSQTTKKIITFAAIVALTGCATSPSGILGFDAFLGETQPVIYSGPTLARDAAKCFQEQGKFLPLSEFTFLNSSEVFSYRLRINDIWFEQISIFEEGSGSRAEIRLAQNLNQQWKNDFQHDRINPLLRCIKGVNSPVQNQQIPSH